MNHKSLAPHVAVHARRHRAQDARGRRRVRAARLVRERRAAEAPKVVVGLARRVLGLQRAAALEAQLARACARAPRNRSGTANPLVEMTAAAIEQLLLPPNQGKSASAAS